VGQRAGEAAEEGAIEAVGHEVLDDVAIPGERDQLDVRANARREVFGDRFVAILLTEDVAFGNQTDPKRRPRFAARGFGGVDGFRVPTARGEDDEPNEGDEDGSATRISQ
jgi:hypothetical protein